jgi:hypothetical protein
MEEESPVEVHKKRLAETRPWDLLSPSTDFVSESVQEERYSICKKCPEFIGLTTQCKKCGCFMKLKTKILLSSCPLNKW